MQYLKPDETYVSKQLEYFRQLDDGAHQKVKELEALRYLEDHIYLGKQEQVTGQEIRIGLSAELNENVKAAVTANPPITHFTPGRDGADAQENSSKREKFWNAVLRWMNYPTPTIDNWVDGVLSLGYSTLKVANTPWPFDETHAKGKREKAADYNERMRAYKRKWGPPLSMVNVHPLSSFFDPGATIGGRIQEFIEYGWKSKATVFGQYNIRDDRDLASKVVPIMPSQPEQFVRPLPKGVDTSTMCLVLEYYNPQWYQVYVNRQKVYEIEWPNVCYFPTPGRSTSSTDPDKWGLSIAENLRKNEPIINRNLTRLAETTERLVKKRLVLTVPEGEVDPATGGMSEDGNPTTRSISLKDDSIETLRPGEEIKDPFAGIERAYDALPFIQMMIQITGQHGVSPIFKGLPPGAAGSGYRDNSLYMMARSQFNYIMNNLNYNVAQVVEWMEWCLVHHIKEPIYIGNLSLSPSDVEKWPCEIKAEFKPVLPQNFIAEGEFWSRMAATDMSSKRRAREQGLGIEQPDEEDDQILIEKTQQLLGTVLIQDVAQTVLGRSLAEPGMEGGPDSGGNPTNDKRTPNPAGGGANAVLANDKGLQGVGRDAGRAIGGRTSAGQGRTPAIQPGGTEKA